MGLRSRRAPGRAGSRHHHRHTQIFFNTDRRPYVIIDAPGHKEFLKNTVSGAAPADAAILVVDAMTGSRSKRRHGYILYLLGLEKVVVCVNKMEQDYSQSRFGEIRQEVTDYLAGMDIVPTEASGPCPPRRRTGFGVGADELVRRADRHQRFGCRGAEAAADDLPLRFPIQDVYTDELILLDARKENRSATLCYSARPTHARVKSIESWSVPNPPMTASAGESVGIPSTINCSSSAGCGQP